MALTMAVVTLCVFYVVNLEPNLKKLALNQTHDQASEADVETWLQTNGYREPFLERYAQWVGVSPKEASLDPKTGMPVLKFGFCQGPMQRQLSGLLEGNLGCSATFKVRVTDKIIPGLKATGILMFWVLMVMIPSAVFFGVMAGMREGSRTDRTFSVLSIIFTSTPEYVSGVIFTVIFASWLGWLNGSAASATSTAITIYNFTLPVMTLSTFGTGYLARITRASMAEVMMAQYIRTARLKGLTLPAIVIKHALRNALIAPFTVIMMLFPWLLTGVVVVETMFRYQGFGYLLVQAAANNDIDLLLSCSIVSVVIVLVTQLLSDVGYAFLNPRIRVQ
ncbi:ABC transporter permease [Bradyrhizobium sp. CW4]|uniref:ABC transporter permease n=1 Tax=Bradyrhizobium sp. CW4 TaxID=2782687 RepID=UPI001FFAFF17|nr:ABC transporter permease [Bradyrhizobium sp. CW4]